jgi:hypothetical protein
MDSEIGLPGNADAEISSIASDRRAENGGG